MKKLVSILTVIVLLFCVTGCNMSPQREVLNINESIVESEFLEYTLQGAIITDTIKDNNLSKEPENGSKWFCLIFTFKNLTTDDLSVSNLLDLKLKYDNKQNYKNSNYYVIGTGAFDTKLEPLKETKVYLTMSIPDEVANNKEKINAIIKIKDKEYTYAGTDVDVVSDFIKTIKGSADSFYRIYQDFANMFLYELQIQIAIDRDAAVEKVFKFVQDNKPEIESTKLSLNSIQVPKYYHNGYEAYINSINDFDRVLEVLSDKNKLTSPEIYNTASEIVTNEFLNNAKIANENLSFLADTKYKNIK